MARLTAPPRRYILIALPLLFLGILLISKHNTKTSQLLSSKKPAPTITNAHVLPSPLASEQSKWEELIQTQGAEKAYAEFKKAMVSLDRFKQHQNAHTFGSALYLTRGVQGAGICDDSFASGCYHSFFESAIRDKGLSIASALDDECRNHQGIGSFGCPHGIGHGLLSYVGEKKLADALTLCTQLRYDTPLVGCQSGVFMEYNIGVGLSPTTIRRFTPDDPTALCNTVSESFKRECYHELPRWWFGSIHTNNVRETIGTLCHQIQQDEYRHACDMKIGEFSVGPNLSDASSAKNYCHELTDIDDTTYCLIGAAAGANRNLGSTQMGDSFCQSLPKEWQSLCKTQTKLQS